MANDTNENAATEPTRYTGDPGRGTGYESAIERALARRDAQFDSLADAVITTNLHGFVLDANRAAAIMLSVPIAFLIGRPLVGFVARRDCRALRAALKTLATTGEVPWLDVLLRPRNGEAPFCAEARAYAERGRGASSHRVHRGASSHRVHWVIRDHRTKPVSAAPARPGEPASEARAKPATRVLLVDDHRMMLSGLRALLDAEDDIEVLGAAEDGASAVRLAAELAPEVVVMDVLMPGLDGIEATRRIKANSPQTRIVGLSAINDGPTTAQMIKAGATGYLRKDAAFGELAQAIRAAMVDVRNDARASSPA